MYHFIALSHQALVIMTLFYLPFGKLFHVVQRPASVGTSPITGASSSPSTN